MPRALRLHLDAVPYVRHIRNVLSEVTNQRECDGARAFVSAL
jgi:hypothetical protein